MIIPPQLLKRIVAALKAAADLGWPFDIPDIQELSTLVVNELQFKHITNHLRIKNVYSLKTTFRIVEKLKCQRAEAETEEVVDSFINTMQTAYDIANIYQHKVTLDNIVFNLNQKNILVTTKGGRLNYCHHLLLSIVLYLYIYYDL